MTLILLLASCTLNLLLLFRNQDLRRALRSSEISYEMVADQRDRFLRWSLDRRAKETQSALNQPRQ